MPYNLMTLSRDVEADLDWRHAELAIFREILTVDSLTEVRRSVLFRAAWALLYAHYEGFCKYALQALVYFIGELPDCSKLTHNMFLFFHEQSIKSAKSMSSADVYTFFRETVDALKAKSPPEITIDTKSNLWPKLLEQLLESLDLAGYDVIEHKEKIRTLVARRNDIAHGQKVFIKDLTFYLEYENAVRNLMYALALAIVDRAAKF